VRYAVFMNGLTVLTTDARPPKLLTQVRERIRFHHYALSTEKAYLHWIRFFIRFSGLRHPNEMGVVEVAAFLSHLANERQVSASTHKQALSAILFLHKEVLRVELPWLQEISRPRTTRRLPEVLTVQEITKTLSLMSGESATLAKLLYGTGMRILEGLRLRTKDVDFDRGAIIVRESKGSEDRVVMLPRSLRDELRQQLRLSHALWEADRAAGVPGVEMPHALAVKYPKAAQTWGWHWVFPQATLSIDPRSGERRRHHAYAETFRRTLTRALRAAGVTKAATVHTLLGHADVSTTMTLRRRSGQAYTHVLKVAGGAPSPLDALNFDVPLRHRDDACWRALRQCRCSAR
jgi:integron integrase